MSQLSYPLISAEPASQLMTALINGEKVPSNAWKKRHSALSFLAVRYSAGPRLVACSIRWPPTRCWMRF